ncbi:MAG: Bax inhibitor-1/YccA family protein [Nocardioidaceae bacterium]
MRSNNPVFGRSEGFNGQAAQDYGNQAYPAGGQGYQGYGQQSPQPQYQQGYGEPQPGYGQPPRGTDPASWNYPTGQALQERMTIDSVVMRTATTLAVVVVAAALTWVAMPQEYLGLAWMIGAFGGLGMAFAVSFMRTVRPAFVLAYAALEGVFLGAISEVYQDIAQGAVTGAVLGTVAAFVATLAAYKFFNIQVTDKFRKFVTIAMFGFFAVLMLDLVLSLFGSAIGFGGFGTLGLITSFVGLGIGILMLILDFDMVEQGVRAGLPEQESWRAAFGLTVTLIWIYINLLRILAILQSD